MSQRSNDRARGEPRDEAIIHVALPKTFSLLPKKRDFQVRRQDTRVNGVFAVFSR